MPHLCTYPLFVSLCCLLLLLLLLLPLNHLTVIILHFLPIIFAFSFLPLLAHVVLFHSCLVFHLLQYFLFSVFSCSSFALSNSHISTCLPLYAFLLLLIIPVFLFLLCHFSYVLLQHDPPKRTPKHLLGLLKNQAGFGPVPEAQFCGKYSYVSHYKQSFWKSKFTRLGVR